MTQPQLDVAAGYTVSADTAIAMGNRDCRAFQRGYERIFGKNCTAVLGACQFLARTIGSGGGRRVGRPAPRCCDVMSDVLSLAALLDAAQEHECDRRYAHLCSLMSGCKDHAAHNAADAIGKAIVSAGMLIDQPSIDLKTAAPHRS